jgi:hypothetical protein
MALERLAQTGTTQGAVPHERDCRGADKRA